MKKHPFSEFEAARLRFCADLLRALSPIWRALRFRKTADGMNQWAADMDKRAEETRDG